MRSALLGLLFSLPLAGPALAQPAPAITVARPAFWTAHGAHSTVFILSSVHALPPTVAWRSPQIDDAAKSSDAFVFEVADDTDTQDESIRFVRRRGLLPAGETLESDLSPSARRDYFNACTLAGTSARAMDNKRPWLAAVLLTVFYMNQRDVTYANSPDEYFDSVAVRDKKDRLYLDTPSEQLEFLSRFDRVRGVGGFSAMVGDFANQPAREDKLIAAWNTGDNIEMYKRVSDAFASDPDGLALIASHDRIWATKLENYLATNRNYFVVAGIAHLVGPIGVPALLRSDGYRVDGP
jgi:uncharacterized protein YbaP (TraB family)